MDRAQLLLGLPNLLARFDVHIAVLEQLSISYHFVVAFLQYCAALFGINRFLGAGVYGLLPLLQQVRFQFDLERPLLIDQSLHLGKLQLKVLFVQAYVLALV